MRVIYQLRNSSRLEKKLKKIQKFKNTGKKQKNRLQTTYLFLSISLC